MMVFFAVIYSCLGRGKVVDDVLSCKSNINMDFSDGESKGPLINGVLYINLNGYGDGFLDVSGVITVQSNTYPVYKRIMITHDFNRSHRVGIVVIRTVSSLSLENDLSPQGMIEKLLIGDESLSSNVFSFKKIFDNGYLIGNLYLPAMICINI
ncbi:hypothetical protein [Serratia fonticola]|uniref:hypothetical protein n=1 Tax=Serratia fonticola TaxID=47917 RepID=UPI003AF3A88B